MVFSGEEAAVAGLAGGVRQAISFLAMAGDRLVVAASAVGGVW
jgi:hypothetical protein